MGKRILEGLKVADFTWSATGPQVTRELAEHGATVVRVESHRRPDTQRAAFPFKDGKAGIDRSAFGTNCNTNKLGISLDLNRPQGREVGRRLALWADVVAESMVPGTMRKWGLDYETLSKDKPELIYFSTCQMGQNGPYANYGAYGAFAAVMCGYAHLLGLPGRPPLPLFNNYTDYIAPWFLVIAVIGALRRRRKTGRGMYLDQSQLEAGISFLGPVALDYFVNGRVATRDGNRDPYRAPHGIYPTKTPDRWVAVSVTTQEQWQAFCQAIGAPAWTSEGRFRTLTDRKAHEDDLDKLVSEWTAGHTAEEIMTTLQAVKIPAGVVQTAEDLFNDPQLAHREHFQWLEHPVMGRHSYHSPAYRLSETPAVLTSAGPALGQHNEYVYREILGYSDDEVADMLIEGVITTDADVPSFG